ERSGRRWSARSRRPPTTARAATSPSSPHLSSSATTHCRGRSTSVHTLAPTHEVFNQAPPFEDQNLFELDIALQEALEREGGAWGVDRARDLGAVAGSAEAIEHGRRANAHLPVLKTHDRYGHRIDQVELDPSWHWLLRIGVEREIPSLPWRSKEPGGHAV